MLRKVFALAVLTLTGSVLSQAGQIELTLLTAPEESTVIPNFAALGNPGDSLSSPAYGLGFVISNTDNFGFLLMEQGVSWSGNFLRGDSLLWNQSSGPDTIVFESALQSVGFKLQNDYFGTFTGYLDVYDAQNNYLGQVSEVGVSSSDGDNSAMFIGVRSIIANISKVVISTSGSGESAIGPNNFALGSGSFATPEPSSLALVSGALLAGLAALRRNRK